MRPFLFLCCSAVVSGLVAPQAGIAQQRPPIFGFANKNRIPEVNKSGSPVFDKLRNEAMKKKLPLVIYLTGSSWCSRCNIFTREYIKNKFQKCRREEIYILAGGHQTGAGQFPGNV